MKKIMTVLLSLMLTAVLICAMAEEVPTMHFSGDYSYILLEDGTAEIRGNWREVKELVIPEELDGHRVTAIGDNAFKSCWSLNTVIIPDSVTTIGDCAFSSCYSLTSVSIPNSVTTIGENPFEYCTKLTSITILPDHPAFATIDGVLFEKSTKTLICYPCALNAKSYSIPKGIRSIGSHAFCSCDSLIAVTIPDSVTTIGGGAFSSCDSLITVYIPDSVTTIGDNAFFGCFSLTSITIPDSVAIIGKNPFQYCTKLSSIFVSPDHPTLETVAGVLFEKSTKTLICYPHAFTAQSYAIPQGTKSVGDVAFYYNRTLTSVILPDSVTTIGNGAFYSCESLSSIIIPDSVTTIGNGAFASCKALTSITIPASVTNIGEYAFGNCRNVTFTVERDSYAAQWCKDNGLPYTYPDFLDWLYD